MEARIKKIGGSLAVESMRTADKVSVPGIKKGCIYLHVGWGGVCLGSVDGKSMCRPCEEVVRSGHCPKKRTVAPIIDADAANEALVMVNRLKARRAEP